MVMNIFSWSSLINSFIHLVSQLNQSYTETVIASDTDFSYY